MGSFIGGFFKGLEQSFSGLWLFIRTKGFQIMRTTVMNPKNRLNNY
jgi:hypothetical protein